MPRFGYPAQHDAIAAIVAATQAALAGGSTPAPPLPTLTITPDTATAPTTGDVVGPFAVGGSVSSSTLSTRGIDVFSDASGTVPVPDGSSVAQGSSLWARYAATVADEGEVWAESAPCSVHYVTAGAAAFLGEQSLADGWRANRVVGRQIERAQISDELPHRLVC